MTSLKDEVKEKVKVKEEYKNFIKNLKNAKNRADRCDLNLALESISEATLNKRELRRPPLIPISAKEFGNYLVKVEVESEVYNELVTTEYNNTIKEVVKIFKEECSCKVE